MFIPFHVAFGPACHMAPGLSGSQGQGGLFLTHTTIIRQSLWFPALRSTLEPCAALIKPCRVWTVKGSGWHRSCENTEATSWHSRQNATFQGSFPSMALCQSARLSTSFVPFPYTFQKRGICHKLSQALSHVFLFFILWIGNTWKIRKGLLSSALPDTAWDFSACILFTDKTRATSLFFMSSQQTAHRHRARINADAVLGSE